LAKLSYLYARDIREFLAPSFSADGLTAVLLRAEDGAGDGVKAALRDCIALGHQLRDLEMLLGISRSTGVWQPIPPSLLDRSGMRFRVAPKPPWRSEEGLGWVQAPRRFASLVGSTRYSHRLIAMPSGVSGLMLSDPTVGLFVVVNRDHPAVRQRFSWCHEYAHLLLDRAQMGHVSRESERSDLFEVRANVFAANFLMLEDGVRQFVATLGKGSASRLHADVFDESGVVPIDSRTAGGSQDLQIYDVVKLSHHFGVSVLSALYRLMNLRLITDKQFGEMKQMDSDGMTKQLADLLGLSESRKTKTSAHSIGDTLFCPGSVPAGEDQPTEVD